MVAINAFFLFVEHFKKVEERKGKFYKNKYELEMYAISDWILLDEMKKKFYFEAAKFIIIEEVAKALGVSKINMTGEFYISQYKEVLAHRISSNGRLRSMHEAEDEKEEKEKEDKEMLQRWFDNSSHEFYYTHAVPLIGHSGMCRLNPAPHWPKEISLRKNKRNT